MQQISIVGRLVSNAQIRKSSTGQDFLYMRIATDNVPKRDDKDVAYFDATLSSTTLAPKLLKGTLVFVSGGQRASIDRRGEEAYLSLKIQVKLLEILAHAKDPENCEINLGNKIPLW